MDAVFGLKVNVSICRGRFCLMVSTRSGCSATFFTSLYGFMVFFDDVSDDMYMNTVSGESLLAAIFVTAEWWMKRAIWYPMMRNTRPIIPMMYDSETQDFFSLLSFIKQDRYKWLNKYLSRNIHPFVKLPCSGRKINRYLLLCYNFFRVYMSFSFF